MAGAEARRTRRRRLLAAFIVLDLGALIVWLLVRDGNDHSDEFKPVNEFSVDVDANLSIVLLQVGFLVIPVALVWLIGAVAIAREASKKGHSFWNWLAAGLVLSPVIAARRLRRHDLD